MRFNRVRNWGLGVWSALAMAYLFLPIFIVMLFSFNAPKGKFNFTWQEFTWDHWKHPFQIDGLSEALSNSLTIALISTLVAVVLGTPVALALVRHRFKGRGPIDSIIFLPLATPEIVLGAALLSLFLTMGMDTGYVTVVIAHVMFCLSYVVVTVKARLEGMDGFIEEASMDLGANRWKTFWLVTLPSIAPGVASAALLSFVLSVDDFVITNFNAGQTITFPLFIWGAAQRGVPPEVNVLATALLLIALTLMAVNLLFQRAKTAK